MKRCSLVLAALAVFAYGALVVLAPREPAVDTGFGQSDLPGDQGLAEPMPKIAYKDAEQMASSAGRMDNRSLAGGRNGSDPGLLALRREVSRLRAELAALRRDLDQLLRDNPGAIVESEFDTSAEKTPEMLAAEEAEARENSRQQWHERLTEIDALLQKEPVDPVWSGQVSARIQEVLNRGKHGRTYLFALDCRSTLCRLEVQHDDPNAASDFANGFPGEVAELFPKIAMGHADEGDGYSHTVLYLVREGYRLPDWEVSF